MHRSRRSLGFVLAALAAVGAYVLFTAGRESGPGTGKVDPERAVATDGPGAMAGAERSRLASRPVAPASGGMEETRLEGVVLDGETGDAVRGVRVRWGAIEASTDAGGTYRLRAEGTHPDVEEIVARAEGFVDGSTSCDRQVWSPAGRLAPIRLARVRERRPGRVRDGLDRPVEGAVILVGPGNERYVSRADGSFGPVPIGDRGVDWRAFGVQQGRAQGTWDRDSKASDLEVVLPVAAFVDGEVVDEGGRPVARAEVFVLRRPDELRLPSGPDGRFRWPLPPAARETLAATTAEAAGVVQAYAGAPTRIVVRQGERLPEPSSASPPPSSDPRYREGAERVTIGSQVVDDRGRPLAGAEVLVKAPDGSWQAFERTDADGRFVLEVYAAPVDVTIGTARHSDWRQRVDAGRTEFPSRVTLPHRVVVASAPEDPPAPRPRVLEGRVLDAEGKPVPGVDVRAMGTDSSDATDARGRFALDGLPTDRPGRVTVQVLGAPPLEVVAPLGPPSLEVVLPGRGGIVVLLRGAPTDEDAPSPPQILLGTSDAIGDFFQLTSQGNDCATDVGGRIRVVAPVGRFVLLFRRAPGAWVRFAPVDVLAGRETQLTYDFPAFGPLRVLALDPDGAPVADAMVSLAEVDSPVGSTSVDGVLARRLDPGDARFPAGVHRLRVVAEDFVPAFTEPVDLRQDVDVSVRLARGESLSGDVADAEGQALGRGSLSWRAPFGPTVFVGRIDAEGSFGPLLPLPAGRQVLVLTRAGSPDLDLPLDVRPGASAQPLHLRLP